MPTKAITIHLEGTNIPIEDFSEAVAGWVSQLTELRNELVPNAQVKWVISELKKSSARCTIFPEPQEGTSDDDVDAIISGYEDEWEAFKRGEPSRHSYLVQSSTRRIAGVLNGRIPAMRTEVLGKEITITTEENKSAFKISKGFSSFGVVKGKVQTISIRATNHFLLYDLEDDHAITCYLSEGSEDKMKEVWGKVALVEGELLRDAKTGKVTTVRDVTVIQAAHHGGSWRDAVGIAPPIKHGISPEAAIRRTRG